MILDWIKFHKEKYSKLKWSYNKNDLKSNLNENESDMSEIFYGKDPEFHEWCLDFFNYSWENAGSFQESKLNK